MPATLRTDRLTLRRWSPDDAPALQPLLVANHAHLAPWIPARVAEPAPVAQLRDRLSGFSAAFDAGREWRYAIVASETQQLLGEVGLYPRDAMRRVAFDLADRVEIGYWLRADATGHGFVSEAVQAMVQLVHDLPHVRALEIRCDALNHPSAAVPRRLGFRLADTVLQPGLAPDADPIHLQVWTWTLDT